MAENDQRLGLPFGYGIRNVFDCLPFPRFSSDQHLKIANFQGPRLFGETGSAGNECHFLYLELRIADNPHDVNLEAIFQITHQML